MPRNNSKAMYRRWLLARLDETLENAGQIAKELTLFDTHSPPSRTLWREFKARPDEALTYSPTFMREQVALRKEKETER